MPVNRRRPCSAYCEMVFANMLTGNWQRAEESAREALRKFPAIQPNTRFVPPLIGEIFNRQREAIFGSLKISSVPDSAAVFLNGKLVGSSPLTLEYVEIGEVNLQLLKPGYRELSIVVSVLAGDTNSIKYTLDPEPKRIVSWTKAGFCMGLGTVVQFGKMYRIGNCGTNMFGYIWIAVPRYDFLAIQFHGQLAFLKSEKTGSYYTYHNDGLYYGNIGSGFELSSPNRKNKIIDPYFSVGIGLYYLWRTEKNNDFDVDYQKLDLIQQLGSVFISPRCTQ
ncbi:MAG: PEGA domain-containing protein [Candidatus Krumholzibacteriota bacterium]|nr:PEGA domain-containing protein [Candidatus Krumholzibacteriota bacterium]